MSVRLSLLAILDQGPCYGYQLRSEFDRRTGSGLPLNVGQIYNTLDRLERDGMVAKDTPDRDGHVYYQITLSGRRAVAEWLASAVLRPPAARDELVIKLAMATSLPGADPAALIDTQRRASNARLSELAAARDVVGALGSRLIVEASISAVEAELLWLDRCAALLEQAETTGADTWFALSTEQVKRGRPVSR